MTMISAEFVPDATVHPTMALATQTDAQPQSTADISDLPQDAQLYLRHTEGGVSIRALARETGCHASTISRRMRKFEQRRDDPLLDRALTAAGGQGRGSGIEWSRVETDQARRILRRLSEPGAELLVAEAMEKALVTRQEVRTAILDRSLAEKLALQGWISLKKDGRVSRHVISAAGRAALKAMSLRRADMPGDADLATAHPVQGGMHEDAAPFDHADQHRVWEKRTIEDPEDQERKTVRFNLGESPLLLIARRRDANGQPFLEPLLVAAGERLREDFELAQLGPRVAQNWDGFLTAGTSSGWNNPGFGSGSDGARNRVAGALRELGPGMGDLVLRVCCFLEGIEMTERRLGWPARSAKIVLRLALMRLDRHYNESYGAGGRMIG
ncbi:MAG: helix-turn-helix domain containing protein [Paracoccus denitrificans]|nr:MAG: helix-turn-helix domain containing protein [Paracoccus denitrificans]PZO83194.1 MAG: helix-turn-helix domain containing protein [Paracoccus denitrificans]